jgi:DNA-3-methyladenine glycosylase I
MSAKAPAAKTTAAAEAVRLRCAWAVSDIMIRYHDEEWGVPSHDDRHLFEMLILEGAQAGLSWEIVLRKRERYREVFDDFAAAKIARYGAKKARRLLADPGIIRNRLKVSAAVGNAQAFLATQREFGSFDQYIWGFAKPASVRKASSRPRRITRTAESDSMAKDLKRREFRFVGTTICYAFMQAVGMVNDHSPQCYRA